MKFLLIPFIAIVFCNSARVNVLGKTTDARGLTSVIYTRGTDTLALDYLTLSELDSLVQAK